MSINSPTYDALMGLGAFARPETEEQKTAQAAAAQALLDSAANAAGQYAADSIRVAAIAAAQEWVSTGDLDEGETLVNRLDALMVGIADDNKDGDITDDEDAVVQIAYNAAADWMEAKGANSDDVTALVEGGDADAASRIVELLQGAMGIDGYDDVADIDSFVFDSDSAESVLDGVLDAVYKKKIVVRGGKKQRVMKRVSGHIRLSAAQKVGIRKAQRKAHSATARMHRMKSMKIRRRAGL